MFSSRLATALVLALMLAPPPTRASEPPQTEESLLEQLEGATGSSSSGYRVAYELGRLRSASGLRKIAEKGDHQLVAGFNHGMSLAERDRGGALPPDLEKVIVDRHDPSRVWSGAILVTCLQATARSGHHEFQILPSKEDFGSDLQNPFPAAAKAFVAATGIDLPLAPDPRLETPEETWALFLRSLKSGDRNSALQCFGLRMRMTVEALFARMSDAELAKMGSDFGADLKPAEKGNALGRQYVASGGKGEKASVAIDFENDNGEWRIRSM